MKNFKTFLTEGRALGQIAVSEQSAVKFMTFLVKASQQIDRIRISSATDSIIISDFQKGSGGDRPHRWGTVVVEKGTYHGQDPKYGADGYTGKARAPYGKIMEVFRGQKVKLEEV